MVADAVLLVRFGSVVTRLPFASLNWTDAVLVIAVEPMSVLSLMVALWPAVIPPRLQLNTVPVREQTPCVVLKEENVPGMVSASVMSAALPGPPLLTVIV